MNNPYLISGLRNGPLCVQRILALIPSDKLDTKTDPDRFTPREVVAHLADWEPILRGRIEWALRAPGVEIAGIDESERAKEKKYASTDPQEQVELFIAEREKTITIIQKIEPAEWHYEVNHKERGIMTTADQTSMLLGHDLYHIDQLLEFVSSDLNE